MKSPRPMPRQTDIARLLERLLEIEIVASRRARRSAVRSKAHGAAATYRTKHDRIGAVLVMDLSLAAHLGAALSLLPNRLVAACLEAEALDDLITENIFEVCNVLAMLFVSHHAWPSLCFDDLHLFPPALPSEVCECLAKPAARLDLDLSIRRRRVGEMSLVLPREAR